MPGECRLQISDASRVSGTKTVLWAGIAERETARKAMRRWRELRATVINVAFLVKQLTKTGRRRCCVC